MRQIRPAGCARQCELCKAQGEPIPYRTHGIVLDLAVPAEFRSLSTHGPNRQSGVDEIFGSNSFSAKSVAGKPIEPHNFCEIRRMKMASKSTTRVISDDQILGGAPVVSDKHLSS